MREDVIINMPAVPATVTLTGIEKVSAVSTVTTLSPLIVGVELLFYIVIVFPVDNP